jgi:predicted AlkP superfamily phosphohydrolase/phosphomutase
VKTAPAARIDFQRSVAHYVRIYDSVGGIRVNVSDSDARRRAICDELMRRIRAVTDPATAKPIVRMVTMREELYSGPHGGGLPDIILVMEPEYGGSDRLSNYSAVVTDRPSISDPGSHRLEGIFLMAGPQVRAVPGPLQNLRIEDIAPTVLHTLGLPIPMDMDGRAITEGFTPGSKPSCPPEMGAVLGTWPGDVTASTVASEISPEDELEIRERLAALGYVE